VQACHILNTHQLQRRGNKTDKIDATRLVKILAYNELMESDPQRRPYIYVPANDVQELRALFSTYSLTKKMMTQVANRIHSIYKQNGMPIDRKKLYSRSCRDCLVRELVLPAMWLVQVCSLLNQLETLEAEKKQLHDVICFRGIQLFGQEVRLLLGIHGFSLLTATALMADIVTIQRFSSAKKFCSYLRTAPRVQASNETVHLGRTNKQGRALTCTLLTQSVMHFPKIAHYGQFNERIKGGKKPCIVRMALIRKVLVSAYYMLTRKQRFHWIDQKSYARKLQELTRLVKKFEKTEPSGLLREAS
jgi:transposase